MAKKKIRTIVWSKNATKQYYQILEYLAEEAPDAVSIVGNALLDMIDALALEYNNYPPDRFKKNNDGTFKAALVFNYRVSYRINEKDIFILRIRHTSREPMNY
jgi:plasmid stabilization system protein ParE